MSRILWASFTIFVSVVLLVERVHAQNQTSLPANFYTGVSSDSSGSYLTAAALNGPIYYSDDRGVSWKVSDAPNPVNYLAVAASSTGQYVIAESATTILVSSDYGEHFTTAANISGRFNSVAVSGTGQYMVSISDSVTPNTCLSYSNNYGASFVSGLGPNTTSINSDGSKCVGVGIDASGTYVVLSVYSQGLWVSNNVLNASAWQLTYEYDVEISAIAFGGTSFYAGYVSTPAYVVQSTDYGYTWTVKGSVYDQIRSIAVDSTGVNVLLASYYHLYLSQDSGTTYDWLWSSPAVYNCAMNGNTTVAVFTSGINEAAMNVFVGNPRKKPLSPSLSCYNFLAFPQRRWDFQLQSLHLRLTTQMMIQLAQE